MRKVKMSFEGWEAEVKIDDRVNPKEMMEEQLLFWTAGESRIAKEDGDIEKAYLKMLAQEMLPLSQGLNISGVKSEFKNREGWGSLDGKFGVTLTAIDSWYVDEDDISVMEI